jgi:hypothetical protein
MGRDPYAPHRDCIVDARRTYQWRKGMTTREELKALAETVQKLTGPDRSVDAAIQRALGSDNGEHWFCGADGQLTKDDLAPAFTTSLDAAMSLVPEGWHMRINGVNNSWHVSLNPTWHGAPPIRANGFAATPALALTAAALLALAAEGGSDA